MTVTTLSPDVILVSKMFTELKMSVYRSLQHVRFQKIIKNGITRKKCDQSAIEYCGCGKH